MTNLVIHRFYKSIMLDWTPSDQDYWHNHLHPLEDPEYIIKDVLKSPGFLTYIYIFLTTVALAFGARYSARLLSRRQNSDLEQSYQKT